MNKETRNRKQKQVKRAALIIAGIFVLLFVTLLTPRSDYIRHKEEEQSQYVSLPTKSLKTEETRVKKLEEQNTSLMTKLNHLQKELHNSKKEKEDAKLEKIRDQEILQAQIQERVEQELLKQMQNYKKAPSDSLPAINDDIDQTESKTSYQKSKRVILKSATLKGSQSKLFNHIAAVVPRGTVAKAILLTGVALPCGVTNVTNGGVPVLLKIVDDGLLPLGLRSKLKNALVIGHAVAELPNERINIRIDSLTIYNKNGTFVDTSVIGHVLDRNYYGVKAKKIERSGPAIWKAFLSSFAGSLTDYLRTTLNAQSIAMATNGLPNSGVVNLDILKNSSLQGATAGMNELAQYFIKKAEQLVPVLEVPGGIKVDIVFDYPATIGDKETHLQVKKEREKSRGDTHDW